jgi:hypothetical protein
MTIKHDENTWALTSKPWGFYPQDGDSSLLKMGTEPENMFFFPRSSRINMRISWRFMVLIGVAIGIFNPFNIAGGCGSCSHDSAILMDCHW